MMLLFAVLFVILGLSFIFMKDFWWGLRQSRDPLRGLITRKPTPTWEFATTFVGIISIFLPILAYGISGITP